MQTFTGSGYSGTGSVLNTMGTILKKHERDGKLFLEYERHLNVVSVVDVAEVLRT